MLTSSHKHQAWATGLKGMSCTDQTTINENALYSNELLNEGCEHVRVDGVVRPFCGVFGHYETGQINDAATAMAKLKTRCGQAFADESMVWLSFSLSLICIALGFLEMKRRGVKPTFKAFYR